MVLDRTRVASARRVPHVATAYRNQAPRYDPRSGEGARINGGRFTPPGSFATLYPCETRSCVVAELTRQGTLHVVGVEGLLPRVLYEYELDLHRVLDLTDRRVRDHLGITDRDLIGEDRSTGQQIGAEAYASGDQAIRTFSATGVDTVLVVFPELVGGGLINVELIEEWNGIADLA